MDKVRRARKKSTSERIDNYSASHAIFLLENLMESAIDDQKEIKIVCGVLRDDLYDPLVPTLKKCLVHGIKVSLIVLDSYKEVSTSAFGKTLLDSEHGTVSQAKEQLFEGIPHYFLVGTDRFRVVIKHEGSKGVGCFNCESAGEILENLFDGLAANEKIKKIG